MPDRPENRSADQLEQLPEEQHPEREHDRPIDRADPFPGGQGMRGGTAAAIARGVMPPAEPGGPAWPDGAQQPPDENP